MNYYDYSHEIVSLEESADAVFGGKDGVASPFGGDLENYRRRHEIMIKKMQSEEFSFDVCLNDNADIPKKEKIQGKSTAICRMEKSQVSNTSSALYTCKQNQ